MSTSHITNPPVTAPSGATLETIGRAGDASPAPFLRAELDNGLRVLVRENRSAPLVAVDCWLGVGALHEEEAYAGISHFLEHMFFKGTERYPLGSMDRLVKSMGGYNNAATSMEFTHYYIVTPSEHFETALDLLADHLRNPTFPDAELERERSVVKEEIRRRNDSPQGRLYVALSEHLFGDSPYAREVLGSPESLERITTSVMRDYWRSHYRSDRLAVAVAGNVEPGRVLAAVAERLGDLERSEAPLPTAAPSPATLEVEPIGMDIAQGYLAWGFRTAGRSDLDEACALEVAVTALGDGMTSRLYRRLVDERRLVTSVGAWTYALERAGVLGISAVLPPDRRRDVEEETARVLQEAAAGLSADEIGRAKTMLAADFAFDNETNAATTGTLGEFEVVHGGAGRYREILDGIARVSPETATAVLDRLARPDGAVRAWVGPNGA
ncbi:MAG TPA: pitrilysin family protein [Gemmatimonadota bacterium]|nr:pitrilysin family protein [Gemmatimonadota bacterium]